MACLPTQWTGFPDPRTSHGSSSPRRGRSVTDPAAHCRPAQSREGHRQSLMSRLGLGNVPLRLVGAFAEEVLAHLLLEVLARARVGEVQPVLVHEHLLVLEPA